MATTWFDGDTLTITPDAGTMTIDGKIDWYSDWKDWVKLPGNAKYPPAFDTTGGDPISATQTIAPYFFLRNDLGWTLKSPNANTDFTIIGNVYPRDSLLPFIEDGAGTFLHRWTFQVSPQALQVGGITQQQARDAMQLTASDGTAPIDLKLNNNFAVSAAAL